MKECVIIDMARTPIGGFQGDLSEKKSPELGAAAVKAAVERSSVNLSMIDELIMGCVLPAGLRQAPARQVSVLSGLPNTVTALTLNKVCGSGMQSILVGSDQIKLGEKDIVVAGGMESMSNAPLLARKFPGKAKVGHLKMEDHMLTDGLEDAFDSETLMGHFAEKCAEYYHFTREDQDKYAISSLNMALDCQAVGKFEDEIIAVESSKDREIKIVKEDEQPKRASVEKIPLLRPAFKPEGTITAANSSSISDGAAAVVLSSQQKALELGLQIRAKIVGYAGFAQEASWFTTSPIFAAKKLLTKINWTTQDVDLWEVNEAFAVVPMAFMRELNIPRNKINQKGGACALGHPIGASGARIVVTLISSLEQQRLKRGIAAICLGGGEALALAIEIP